MGPRDAKKHTLSFSERMCPPSKQNSIEKTLVGQITLVKSRKPVDYWDIWGRLDTIKLDR
jgi:hypothetical protein